MDQSPLKLNHLVHLRITVCVDGFNLHKLRFPVTRKIFIEVLVAIADEHLLAFQNVCSAVELQNATPYIQTSTCYWRLRVVVQASITEWNVEVANVIFLETPPVIVHCVCTSLIHDECRGTFQKLPCLNVPGHKDTPPMNDGLAMDDVTSLCKLARALGGWLPCRRHWVRLLKWLWRCREVNCELSTQTNLFSRPKHDLIINMVAPIQIWAGR
mmetsp:Transcript_73941/g.131193  ORF Transcript_73941/g.131193 Transcript_73941/m.131193 type:complete len:213 (-) Transcript_73941:255-893(-)